MVRDGSPGTTGTCPGSSSPQHMDGIWDRAHSDGNGNVGHIPRTIPVLGRAAPAPVGAQVTARQDMTVKPRTQEEHSWKLQLSWQLLPSPGPALLTKPAHRTPQEKALSEQGDTSTQIYHACGTISSTQARLLTLHMRPSDVSKTLRTLTRAASL